MSDSEQLVLRFPDPAPVYTTVVVEHGWNDKYDQPKQWCHTLSRAHADELLAEAPLLWPGCKVWTEASR